jgi:transcriptional regulator with XRE-family HTH domain
MDMAKEVTDIVKKECASWLHAQFLDFERSVGRRCLLADFADYLGVSERLLSKWMNAKNTPRDDNVIKIANKLGHGIYDVLEWERPKEKPPDTDKATRDNDTSTHPKHKIIKKRTDNIANNILSGGGGKSMNVAIRNTS